MFKIICSFLFLILISSCTSMPDIDIPEVAPPPPAQTSTPQVALVLGGGGAKGYTHIGALKVLEEAGVPIDLIVGASSGSLVGALYADSADAAQLEDILMNAGFFSFADLNATFKLGGFINGARVQKFILENSEATQFDELKIRFAAVATDLATGKPVVLQSGPIPPAINASTALPGLLQPVKLYGHTLVDGAVIESVPVSIAKAFNPEVIIAINANSELTPRIPKTAYGIHSRLYDILWQQLDSLTQQDADIIIQPNKESNDVGTFSIHHKERLIKNGEVETQAALPEILALLQEKGIELKPKTVN